MTNISYALKESLKNGYSFKTFKSDAIAGLIVSLVALAKRIDGWRNYFQAAYQAWPRSQPGKVSTKAL